MTQLVNMRQRIKSIETIKKMTHAMRLIAMSAHSRLRQKKNSLELYKNSFQALWSRVQNITNSRDTVTNSNTNTKQLIILVGSTKGLCGTFNTMLFRYFELESKNLAANADTIAIGKFASDYLRRTNRTFIQSYDDFNQTNFVSIAYSIVNIILDSDINYNSVILFANYSRTFFSQFPHKVDLIPLDSLNSVESNKSNSTDISNNQEYLLEQSPQELTDTIFRLVLAVKIQELLFESLIAEQASRFLSMDAATRSANDLLNSMKLEYNKIRQAAITRELTELSSSFSSPI